MTNLLSTQHALGSHDQVGQEIDTVRALLHDLRQPVTAILLLSSTPGAIGSSALERISQQAQWMAELVDTVLSDAAHDDVVSADVTQVADAAIIRARSTAECTLTLHSETTPVLARSRPVALGRAVACVLDNAVRAAGPGGAVDVRVEARADQVILRVEDDGPGLGRVSPQTSLGLTTTRAMVAACDGAFSLSSREPRGARAEIRLMRAGVGRGRP